ncbi:Ankyrin-repeat and fibronectin type III domain-containing 1 [Podila minutissima]|uniref:Ankyrin-repeat and fibronectin type III domain-containing 1 n=1 Tax=Podila minutissima TaxID=64525 RepID=A0A9P5SI02_9FUNG|nr:Ankyrin-repeat and fibronectin type III domain-containing 1 [Podila minutissima]
MISTVELANNYYAFDTESPDFAWMFKTTLDWAAEIPPSSVTRTETVDLRQEYVAAVSLLQKRLGIPPIHLLYDKVLDLPQVGAKNVIAIQYIKDSDKDQLSPEVLHMGNFRWKSIDGVSSSIYTKKEDIWNCLTSYYDSVRVSRPSPGLYVGLYYTESTMSGMQILVPSQRRSLVPVVKLRNESSLSSAEWDWIRSTASMDTTTLAKKCAVSKDDPLHHLKVEFAHATAKLAKMTKLKWDPSDIYTLDTMKIFLRTSPDSARSAQERQSQDINRDGGHGAQEALSDSLSPSIISSLGLEAPSNQERLAALDLDPVWRGQDLGQESKNGNQDEDTIRVIMFIKPARHASQPQERFNTKQFELSSFPLFDAIHHSVFNTATYHRLRKTMHELSNEIEDLECELEMNMERDRVGKGSKDMPVSEQMSKGNKYPGGIVEDDISSLLINELGIKGEGDMDARSRSPRTLSRSHSINRNSFVSDNALHGPRSSRQSSMYSLLESFEKSGPSVGPVMSIATSYATATLYPSATSYTSCSENIPQAQGNSSLSHSISRQSLLEAANDRELPVLPSGAEVKPENESSASSAEPARAELMRHRSSNGSLSSHSRSVSSASSLKALPLRSSYYGQSYTAAINGHQHPPQQNLHQQQVQQQHQRTESLSLANVAFPRHQRSYSHIQAEIGPQPTNGSLKSRTRTTSQSSSVLQQQQPLTPGSMSGPVSGSVPGTAPMTPRRRLVSANKSGVSSPQAQYLQPPHHNSPNLQSSFQLHLANGITSNVAPKLERLEQQQQQIQQQWRMVSWTRQLSEWDHARMLKSQEQLLGFASTASSQPLPELPTTISL